MKGSQGKKGSSNNMGGGKNPLANSMAHHSSNMATGKSNNNPGTSHMDQRGAKLFEIYSSGKSSGGVAGTGTGGHVASNISNGSGGSQGHQNSFLQNKYQFATYYGQKNYPNSGPHMNMLGNASSAHHQYNGSQIGIGGNNASSQYEHSIDGQIEPANLRTGPSNPPGQGPTKGSAGGPNTIASKSSGNANAASGAQTQGMPKRTNHSELTSY